jgi:hypothetical protein
VCLPRTYAAARVASLPSFWPSASIMYLQRSVLLPVLSASRHTCLSPPYRTLCVSRSAASIHIPIPADELYSIGCEQLGAYDRSMGRVTAVPARAGAHFCRHVHRSKHVMYRKLHTHATEVCGTRECQRIACSSTPWLNQGLCHVGTLHVLQSGIRAAKTLGSRAPVLFKLCRVRELGVVCLVPGQVAFILDGGDGCCCLDRYMPTTWHLRAAKRIWCSFHAAEGSLCLHTCHKQRRRERGWTQAYGISWLCPSCSLTNVACTRSFALVDCVDQLRNVGRYEPSRPLALNKHTVVAVTALAEGTRMFAVCKLQHESQMWHVNPSRHVRRLNYHGMKPWQVSMDVA